MLLTINPMSIKITPVATMPPSANAMSPSAPFAAAIGPKNANEEPK